MNTVYNNHQVQFSQNFNNDLRIMLRLINPKHCFPMVCFQISKKYRRIQRKVVECALFPHVSRWSYCVKIVKIIASSKREFF